MMRDDATLSIRFNDDALQHNHVKISTLPSGWRAFGGLLAWLCTRPEGSICIAEEPETHLHPTLQRVLIREMARIADERHLQIFATTHSPTMIDYAVPQPAMRLFEVNGWRCRALSEPAAAVLAVGARPSDLCLANGLVWVEGSSDRVYLLHWLSLWCKAQGCPMPVENVDYAFAYYGGSLLAHYSVAQTDAVVGMFGINPNAFLLMDRDLDFSVGPDGNNAPVNATSTKARIREDMLSYGSQSRVPWVTDGYTIESYLPDTFREDRFRIEQGRLVPRGSGKKVAIANTFAKTYQSFEGSHSGSSLPLLIEALHQTIRHWQH